MLNANTFPTLGERDNVATIGKLKKLYANDSMNVLGLHELIKKQYKKLSDLVYIAHALPAYITDFYADFVSGDVDDVQILLAEDDTNEDNEKELETQVYENDLKEQLNDWATSQSEFGTACLYAYLDENGLVRYDDVPNDQYFPQGDGSVIIATYKKDPTDVDGKKLVLLTRHFVQAGDKVTISNQAWQCDDFGVNMKDWGIETWNTSFGKSYKAEDSMDLNEMPFVQADNGRKTADGFGKSDYLDIVPQLAEINERRTQIATQFLKNLDAKMILPSSLKKEDGTVDAFDSIFIDDKAQDTARYVTPDMTLMQEAEEHIMSQIRIISTVTGVPLWALTKGSAPEKVESLTIQLFSAIRKAHRKRAKLRRATQDLIRIGFKLAGKELTKDPVIKFGDILPSDDLVRAETESTKVRAGLSSKQSSIMRLEGMDEDEAVAELELIRNEEKIGGAFDVSAPPVFA